MRKSVVAALALAFVGAAAFATVRITVCGVCPLTGEPIHCAEKSAVVCPSTTECPFEDERCDSAGKCESAPQEPKKQQERAPETPPAQPGSRP